MKTDGANQHVVTLPAYLVQRVNESRSERRKRKRKKKQNERVCFTDLNKSDFRVIYVLQSQSWIISRCDATSKTVPVMV